MPYVVNKCEKQYCVYKLKNKRRILIPGGKHKTRKDAISHATAIRISEAKNA